MKKKLCAAFLQSLIISILLCSEADAQTLQQLLDGDRNLSSIMLKVKAYYNSDATRQMLGEQQRQRDLKHWYRWAWYMSSRVNESGDLVDISKKMVEATGIDRTISTLKSKEGIVQQSVAGAWVPLGPTSTTSGIFSTTRSRAVNRRSRRLTGRSSRPSGQ